MLDEVINMKTLLLGIILLFSIVSFADYNSFLDVEHYSGKAVVGVTKGDKMLMILGDSANYLFKEGLRINGAETSYTGPDGSSISNVKYQDFSCEKIISFQNANQSSTLVRCILKL